MKTCPDCGCRVYALGCTNCNEGAYIEQQQVLDEIHAHEERLFVKGPPESKPIGLSSVEEHAADLRQAFAASTPKIEPAYLLVLCYCGRQGEGTDAMLRSAGWRWLVSWKGWACPRCTPKEAR